MADWMPGARLTLNDFFADQPVCQDYFMIDATRHIRASLSQNRNNPRKKAK